MNKTSTLKGKITPAAEGGITVTRPWRGPWMPTLGMEMEYRGAKYILGGYDKGREDDGPIVWWLYLAPVTVTA